MNPMNSIFSLTGTWRLSSVCIPESGLAYGFADDLEPPQRRTRFRAWMDAAVPGCVQQTLLDAGELPDPFYADNLDHWRWVEDREWWYRRSFLVPEDFPQRRVHLVFEALDTCATVFLNGEPIARHASMFRPLTVDVTGKLRLNADNVLAVRLQPPQWHSAFRPGDGTSGFTDPHRVHTRKPQFSFGWDIAPRLMTVGIPGDVRLIAVPDVAIRSACVRTLTLDRDGAEALLVVEVDNHLPSSAAIDIEATLAGHPVRATRTVPSGASEAVFPVRLNGLERWHPRGLGAPALHDADVTIRLGGESDRRHFTFGLRTVELVQRPQSDGGTSFTLRVNGTDLFIKGLNYTPGDALLTRIDNARTDALFKLSYDCNVNLLRVWGGGYYESDHFYDLCDVHGILVWQDFMLGCGQYPQTDAFVAELAQEADFQLGRLRRHPSLVFLAGDNENDCFHYYAGSMAFRHCRLTRGVLQEAAGRLCPDIPYIPSSPISPKADNPLCQTEGDNHLWDHEAPHNQPPYRDDNSRFMSEMGRLSLPPLEVIRRFIPAGQELPLTSRLWQFHAADTERVGFGDRMQTLIDCLAAYGHRIPDTIEGLIELSQQVQADALVYWARKYHASPVCSGIILWNLCDCWPQMSDAIVAYSLFPKKAYYALRDAYGAMESSRSYPWGSGC